MGKGISTWTAAIAAIAAFACIGPLRAHHSIGVFDIRTPIWVKGTVVGYQPVNPHAYILLDERTQNGQVRRWFVDGPTLARLARMGVERDFLSVGDEIEVCAFLLKDASSIRQMPQRTDRSPEFGHGHVLVMPDGQKRFWGPYGKLDNCVNPDESIQAWLDFLNSDSMARTAWCRREVTSIPPSVVSSEFIDEINARMADPCD